MFAEMGKLNSAPPFTEEEAEAPKLTVLFWEIPRICNTAFLTPNAGDLKEPKTELGDSGSSTVTQEERS